MEFIFGNRVSGKYKGILVKYVIWVYAGVKLIIGTPLVHLMLGLVTGVIYVMIKTYCIRKWRIDLWPTPSIFHTVVRKLLDMTRRVNPEEQFHHEDEYD